MEIEVSVVISGRQHNLHWHLRTPSSPAHGTHSYPETQCQPRMTQKRPQGRRKRLQYQSAERTCSWEGTESVPSWSSDKSLAG